jgi:sigma-B regulation protein RsbU (phosphoserine phosphatase)
VSTERLHSAGEAASHALPPALIHDLRSPLGQVIGYAELLVEQAQEAGDDGYVPYLQRIAAAGYQLLGLIEGNFHAAGAMDVAGRDDATPPAGSNDASA